MAKEILEILLAVFLSTGSLASIMFAGSIIYMATHKKRSHSVAVQPEPVVKEVAVTAPVQEKTVTVEEKPEASVAFSADKTQTLEDKYKALDKQTKKYYDDIATYASAVEGVKRFKNNRYEEYKVGAYRVIRLTLKRGIIHCEFLMHNSDFKNYVAENKVSVKHSATVIKVVSADTVKAIKDSIDIVVGNIAAEKEFKKQLAKEKRKARRKA